MTRRTRRDCSASSLLWSRTRPPADTLVMGPWNHGGFSRGDGDRLGNINFGSKTAAYYRERIELPFFLYYLKGRGDGKFPKAWLFQTGLNQWRKFDSWPPKEAKPPIYFSRASGHLAWSRPARRARKEYLVADPAKPVPYVGPHLAGNPQYLYERRTSASRPNGPTCWCSRPSRSTMTSRCSGRYRWI